MSDTPKHCEIAIEYFTLAKEMGGDDYSEVNKLFEIDCGFGFSSPKKRSPFAIEFAKGFSIRRKPETHIVNGHEVPAPYRPAFYSSYYRVRYDVVQHSKWNNTTEDEQSFLCNNCFRSESDAEENRLAMFKLGKYAEVNATNVSAKDYVVKALEVLVDSYAKKLDVEFSEVSINLINKGMGYIHPEGVLEFAREIKSGEFDLGSICEVKS
jgi:hypothetical protein